MTLLGKRGMGVGVVFVLGLFLVGVMMCSITFLASSGGHHLFVKGCDQVSAMMIYMIFDRGQELLTIFMLLSAVIILSRGWQLSSAIKEQERKFENKKERFLVRVVVDPILQSFRRGIIRNLSYN